MVSALALSVAIVFIISRMGISHFNMDISVAFWLLDARCFCYRTHDTY
jgi:hypothetical protein